MKIGIIGAGNLGTAIAADLGRNHKIYIHSSRPEKFGKTLKYTDTLNDQSWESEITLVSDSYADVVSEADLVFVCVPTFMTKNTVDNIAPFLQNETIVGFVPGAGGIEYLTKSLREKGNSIFGFERVPYIARLDDYGISVKASKKPKYRIAVIPKCEGNKVCDIVSDLFQRPCAVMSEFIAMTLTPSLHTSRLYELYRDYQLGDELDYSPLFYGEWTDNASRLTFELDHELHMVCDALTKVGIGADEVVPYPVHYESETPEKLTKKLRSIESLKDIRGPLKKCANGKYILDIESRYFTESYPYRLSIVKGLAVLLSISVPKTDEVLLWYSRLAGKEYYVNGKFAGKDLVECNIPQNYGFCSIESLMELYKD